MVGNTLRRIVGQQVVQALSKRKTPLVVIESDSNLVEIMEHADILYVTGDSASDFMGITSGDGAEGPRMEEILVGERSKLTGQSLRDSLLRSELDIVVVAIRKTEGNWFSVLAGWQNQRDPEQTTDLTATNSEPRCE